MSFNIFDYATKDSIRVGYIDPNRGYVTGKSIYEANVHASKNPGAVFILETRDRIKYLTINEVNELEVDDITPDEVCCEEGIKGLAPDEVPAYPSGSQPVVVSGSGDDNSVKVDASGGTQLTVGGDGGRSVTAGGETLTAGGETVKSGATGGTPIFLGGTNVGSPVLLGTRPLSINGKGVFVGGDGGIPITSGGSGGTELVTDGSANQCKSKIFISGGGGVGAFAVPVVGIDGSILAAIVTDGGFGYKSPPQSRLFDSCRRGVGTVLKTYLGTAKSTTIYYDQEDDFEIYDLTPPFTLSGYGKRFGPDGEELGDWDPNLFASLQESPIAREIRDYQEFLSENRNPWWHTRKETPLQVTFNEKNNQIKHDVQHWQWGGKLAKLQHPPTTEEQFEELEFEIYTEGGNQADRDLQFTFTSEDGKHTFKIKADDFEDDLKTKIKQEVVRNSVYTVVASGEYKGKGVEQGLVGDIGKDANEIKGDATGAVIFADFVESNNDNDDLQVRATQGKFTASNERKEDGHTINDLTYKFESDKDFKPSTSIEDTKKIIEDSFMNRYAISPTAPSNVKGTDYSGRWAIFVWEENFPYSGDYKFRGMADNIGRIFLDNELVLEERKFKGDPTQVISKYVEEGVHEIKVELYNIPVKEKIELEVPQSSGPQELTITYHGLNQGSTVSGETKYPIEVEPLGSLGRGDDAAVIEVNNNKIKFTDSTDQMDTDAEFKIVSTSPGVTAKFKGSDDSNLELVVTGTGDVTLELDWDDDKSRNGKAVGRIQVAGEKFKQDGDKGNEEKTIKVGGNDTTEVVGSGGYIVNDDNNKVEMKDGHGDDINSTFSIVSSTNNARFSDDGKRLETDGSGDVSLKLEWDDKPDSYGVAVEKIEVGGVTLTQSGNKGSDTKTLTIEGSDTTSTSTSNNSQNYESIFNTADYVNKADRQLWRTNVYGRGGFLNDNGVCPFDTKKPLEDNPYAGMHVIRWEYVNFPVDGNYDIEVDVDDSVKLFIGNREGDGAMEIGNGLIDVAIGGDEVIIENGADKQIHTKFFKKGNYRIRAELTQTSGGVFSFDEDGNAGGADVTARFIERDGEVYMSVEGSGSAEIHFRLRVDDDPGNSGDFASKIKIGKGANDSVELKRSYDGNQLKEKETINGSAFFEAGREYLVQLFDSNKDTGYNIKNEAQTIEYDDNISNGFDENADLSITKITNQQPAPVKGINPMALAVDIRVRTIEAFRISAKSWQENPMGGAFTIDAPLPPIPQEPPEEQEGRCPNNPLWSSRFAGGSESWWPVNHSAWSEFTNRFAMSPLPPLSTLNSDGGGGVVYSNTWQVDFPYDGFYGFKGSGDNSGRILIDGEEVYQLEGFSSVSPEIVKKKITAGNHEVTLEVENQDQRKRKKVTKEFFNTQNWIKPLQEEFPPTPAEVIVEYRGLNQGSTETVSGETRYPIEIADQGSKGRGDDAAVLDVYDTKINFTDSTDQMDVDAALRIISTSPGVSAKFKGSDDSDIELVVTGSGDVTLELSWDDNPDSNGKAVGNIEVAGTKIKQDSHKDSKDSKTETIKVGGNDTTEVVGTGGYIVSNDNKKVEMKDGHGDDINSTFSIVSSTVNAEFSPDGKVINYEGTGEITLKLEWDDNPDSYGVAVDSIAVGGTVWDQEGEKNSITQTIQVSAGSEQVGGVESGVQRGGITYDGPTLFHFDHPAWSDLMNKISVSPYTPPLDSDNPNINGDFNLKWTGVNFSESGQYDITFQADNIAKLFINGTEIQEVSSFRGEPTPRYVDLSSGTYDVEIQLTNVPSSKDIFNDNPSGVALKITKEVDIVSAISPPWTDNPVGASAIIIPPPCPKVLEGTGFVERIEVIQPGNGFPTSSSPSGGGEGIPVTLQLVDVIPDKPGIGYKPEDRIIVEVPGRPPIELIPELDTFGRITTVPVTKLPKIPLPEDQSGTPDGSAAGDPSSTGDRSPTGFDIIGNTETQILQVKDLPGQIGVADDTGVLIPLVPSGGSISEDATGVKVPAPGPFYGFIEYPNIYPTSNTGLGFRGRPVFEVVVVPENILPDESVLQVVDIPGLRKTGYVNGKPYYGQVFAKDGNLYAGISETIGQLVPVYATLQESIQNRQTVQPSAILRTGTETNSNNPTINTPI